MFYVYILKSAKFDKFYTGHTDNLERRIREHNSGFGKYSKRYLPWVFIYTEVCGSVGEAVIREKYLKSAVGRRWIKKQMKI